MSYFAFHLLNETGKQKVQFITSSFDEMLNRLEETCPDSREFSIVKSKLEEACFYAKKSVALQKENQEY